MPGGSVVAIGLGAASKKPKKNMKRGSPSPLSPSLSSSYFFGTFFQSFKNFLIPISVSG